MIPWRQQRPDPRLYYFAVPNQIFDYEINAAEFSILAFLFRRRALKLGEPNVRTIRNSLRLSRNTVKKYVRRLRERGLITVTNDRKTFFGSGFDWSVVSLTDKLRLRVGHFFPMPNAAFGFDLSVGEIAVYGYLLFREDRESYECWPSSKTIGAALHMSKNTVLKYVHRLEEKEFIVTEPTQVRRRDGSKWNGNLKYRVRPIQSVVKRWNEKQAEKAKREQKLMRAMKIAEHRPGFTVQPSIPEGRP